MMMAARRPAGVRREAIVTGLLGAATIMIWFLILDVVNGRPLYTPTPRVRSHHGFR